jgi:hypothetical protein
MYHRQRRHLWWSNLEILIVPLHRNSPFIGELRCQTIHMEHGLEYIAERTQNAVYIVRYLWAEQAESFREDSKNSSRNF